MAPRKRAAKNDGVQIGDEHLAGEVAREGRTIHPDGHSVFVTVGSTKFPELINKVIEKETLKHLYTLGFKNLILQHGSMDKPVVSDSMQGINIESYSLKPSIDEDLEKANLVISHGGAGTCLEAIRKNRRLLIVTNENLMNNHQEELGEKLGSLCLAVKISGPSNLLTGISKVCELEQMSDISSDHKGLIHEVGCEFELIFDEALAKVNEK